MKIKRKLFIKERVFMKYNYSVAFVLCLFFGSFGIHRLYLGHTFAAIMYFLFCWTGIPFLISIYDLFRMKSLVNQQ